MKSVCEESRKQHSLSETNIEGFVAFLPDAVRSGNGCLLQIYPARVCSEIYRLTSRRTLLGRDPSCDIALDDNLASRNHAAISADSDGYLLTDLGSTNGTFVNDNRITAEYRLNAGNLIRMGGTILKFMSSQNEEALYHSVIHELMTRDPLTNAFNRSYLIPTLEKSLAGCRRDGTELSVVLLDIDHFKRINDAHGHQVGDEVLRSLCERIRTCLRGKDLLARLGGDEFVVVAVGAQLDDAVKMAERIRLAISSSPFQTQAGPVFVTCSMGVATSDGHEISTVDKLLALADQRLYCAKDNGRNNVRTSVKDASVFSV